MSFSLSEGKVNVVKMYGKVEPKYCFSFHLISCIITFFIFTLELTFLHFCWDWISDVWNMNIKLNVVV